MSTDLNSINASNFVSGVVSPARLGSGTADATTFLRGDNTWQVLTTTPAAGADTQVQHNAGGFLAGSSNFTFNTSTGTLTATNLAGNAQSVQQLDASRLTTGIVPTARLGSGTADASTFLRGDGTWNAVGKTSTGGPSYSVQCNRNGVFGGGNYLLFNPNSTPPTLSAVGTVDTTPLINSPSFRFLDRGNHVKGGFTYCGTPYGALAVPCACGRITLDPNNPAPLGDIGYTSTIYYLPCNGNQITLWNSDIGYYENVTIPDGGWSLSIGGLVSGTLYDLYIQNNLDGTAQLVYGTVWVGNTTRAAHDTVEAGMIFWYNNKRMRYVGTVWIQATGQTQDAMQFRNIWNAYNQVPRKLMFKNFNPAGNGSWTFTNPNTGTTVLRALNGDNVTPRLWFVIGGHLNYIGTAGAQFILVDNSFLANMSYNGTTFTGVALDQSSPATWSNDIQSQFSSVQLTSLYNRFVIPSNFAPGIHWLTQVEGFANSSGGSATIYGYTVGTGMIGWIMA